MKSKEKISDLKKLGKAELSTQLKEKEEKQGRLLFDLHSGKLKNIREIREIRKDIARIFTFLNAKKEN